MLLLLIVLFQLPVVAPESREAAALRQPLRTMAVTIDDLPTVSVLGDDLARAERTTRDLLAAAHGRNTERNTARGRRPQEKHRGNTARGTATGETQRTLDRGPH
ncbi:hypothetical protein BH24ACI5_BH24ACI5_28080 [soil metagenome]